MEYKPTSIFCPKCKRKVATHKGRGQINIDVKCSRCEKLVVFNPTTGETVIRPIPPRTTSSGIRFY